MKFKDKMVKEAILLQARGQIVQEGDENSAMGFRFDVDGYTVRIFNKPGRKLCTCTCKNFVLHSNQPTICKHKLSAIMEWIKLNNKPDDERI